MIKPSLIKLLCIFLLLGCSLNVVVSAEEEDEQIGIILPDIGDPASEILSVNQEAELGKILLAQVNRALPISTDPELRYYIQSLGTRLISGGLNSDFPYYFRLVFNPQINAFALPGGIVAINSGLLLLSDTESELASVVAHEISHVSQRHIARRFSRQSNLSVVNAFALLATIIGGIYGTDVGLGLGSAALSAVQASELAYSRDFEREADRIGMQLLVNANLDPQGMPRFFEKLNAATQGSSGGVPEILRTHPLTISRISDSKNRAEQFSDRPYIENTIHFEYAKARTLAISIEPNILAKRYSKLLQQEANNINYYIYGIALSRLGRGKQAIAALQKIKPDDNEEFVVSIAMAQAHIANRQIDEALEILHHLDNLYPANEIVIFYLATALLEKNQAQQALKKLDQLRVDITGNPAIERLRAHAADKAGQPWRSHESLSDFNVMHALYNPAIEQLLIAKRQPGIDAHSKARIETKINRIQEFREAQN